MRSKPLAHALVYRPWVSFTVIMAGLMGATVAGHYALTHWAHLDSNHADGVLYLVMILGFPFVFCGLLLMDDMKKDEG